MRTMAATNMGQWCCYIVVFQMILGSFSWGFFCGEYMERENGNLVSSKMLDISGFS